MLDEQQIRQVICDIGRRLYEQGFAPANAGNISARLGDGHILTTPTGVSKGYLTPEMLVKVNSGGQVLSDQGQPSSELKMHLLVYARRDDVQAVVHAHPPYATALAVLGCPLEQPLLAEAVVLGPVPLAPYATPGTAEVPASIAPFVAEHNAILLANHGALAYGPDLTSACFRLETLEFWAQVTAISQQLGQPCLLTPRQVRQLRHQDC